MILREIWLLPPAVDCLLFSVGIGSSSSSSSQVISAGWVEEKYQYLSKIRTAKIIREAGTSVQKYIFFPESLSSLCNMFYTLATRTQLLVC